MAEKQCIFKATDMPKVRVPESVSTKGLALLAILPPDLSFASDLAKLPFYERNTFYRCGTWLTSALCSASSRIEGQFAILKYLSCSQDPVGTGSIEAGVTKTEILHEIGNIILSGLPDKFVYQ